MWNLLASFNKNLIVAIPIMMLSGVATGILIDAQSFRSLVIPMTFVMVYPMMVTLDMKKLFDFGDMKAQVLAQSINFCIIPLVAFGIGRVFLADNPFLAVGLLLAALLPTSGMTISWTGLAKGNLAAAVKMTVLGLTLGSIMTPVYLKILIGANLEINLLQLSRQIMIIVFIPMILGAITRSILLKKAGQEIFKKTYAPRLSSISTIGVLVIVYVAMALNARSLVTSPSILVYVIVPLILLYTINFILSTVIGKFFLPRGDAIALVYGTVMRNLSIALAIAMNSFAAQGPDIAIVVSLAYIIQVQSAAWYVRLTGRIFGPAPE